MNFSLTALRLSNQLQNPLITMPFRVGSGSFAVDRSHFSRFAKPFLFSSNSFFSSKFNKVTFERFSSSVITLDKGVFEQQTFTNFSFTDIQEDMIFQKCLFKLILIESGKYCAIYLRTNPVSNYKLEIYDSGFTQVFGNGNGPIVFFGKSSIITRTCFMICFAADKPQTYHLKSSDYVNCTEITRYACSPKRLSGRSHATLMDAPFTTEKYINQSQCSIQDKRALESFGSSCRNLDFGFASYVNCSGVTYFGFDSDHYEKCSIKYGYTYKCIHHVEIGCMIETRTGLTFDTWDFCMTKMLFLVYGDIFEKTNIDNMQFINCRVDMPPNKYTIQNSKWKFENFTQIPKEKPRNIDPDFQNWLCVTDIPPTAPPSPSATPLPTRTASAMPSMTVPIFDIVNKDANAPELIDPNAMVEKQGFTVADYIQLGGLLTLIVITAIVFFLAMKKKKQIVADPEEQEQLLQYN